MAKWTVGTGLGEYSFYKEGEYWGECDDNEKAKKLVSELNHKTHTANCRKERNAALNREEPRPEIGRMPTLRCQDCNGQGCFCSTCKGKGWLVPAPPVERSESAVDALIQGALTPTGVLQRIREEIEDDPCSAMIQEPNAHHSCVVCRVARLVDSALAALTESVKHPPAVFNQAKGLDPAEEAGEDTARCKCLWSPVRGRIFCESCAAIAAAGKEKK